MEDQDVIAGLRRAGGIESAQCVVARARNAFAHMFIQLANIHENGTRADQLGGLLGRNRLQRRHRLDLSMVPAATCLHGQ